ncbi:MAG: hypothetical protein WBM50_15475 [Acidimicrobiales bacterium]
MRVAGYSLSTLLRDEEVVGFMKIDIDYAEHEIFTRNTEWADKVTCRGDSSATAERLRRSGSTPPPLPGQ